VLGPVVLAGLGVAPGVVTYNPGAGLPPSDPELKVPLNAPPSYRPALVPACRDSAC
jgi:hypothetical protein